MPNKGSTLAFTASRVAVEARRGDRVAEAEARRDHAAAVLEQYVQRVVASAPPLTTSQRTRLAALLTGGDAA